MFLFPYDGGYTWVSARNPELLTDLAPREYQEACGRAGGRNLYGKPYFRLAILQSRFQRMGGLHMTFYDADGRYHREEACEAMVPRYRQADGFEDSFVLEVWRSPRWYAQNGFTEEKMVVYDVAKPIRRTELVPPQGGYEGVIWDSDIPWCFTPRGHFITINGQPRWQHRVTPQVIENAIHTWLDALDMTGKERGELRRGLELKEQERARQRQIDALMDKIGPFDLRPTMTMRGETSASRTGHELWREEKHREECA